MNMFLSMSWCTGKTQVSVITDVGFVSEKCRAITAIAACISVIIGRVNRSLKFYDVFSLKRRCQNVCDFNTETLEIKTG